MHDQGPLLYRLLVGLACIGLLGGGLVIGATAGGQSETIDGPDSVPTTSSAVAPSTSSTTTSTLATTTGAETTTEPPSTTTSTAETTTTVAATSSTEATATTEASEPTEAESETEQQTACEDRSAEPVSNGLLYAPSGPLEVVVLIVGREVGSDICAALTAEAILSLIVTDRGEIEMAIDLVENQAAEPRLIIAGHGQPGVAALRLVCEARGPVAKLLISGVPEDSAVDLPSCDADETQFVLYAAPDSLSDFLREGGHNVETRIETDIDWSDARLSD